MENSNQKKSPDDRHEASPDKDSINISEFKKSKDLKNTVVDNDKKENQVDQYGNEVGGEQKRKSG